MGCIECEHRLARKHAGQGKEVEPHEVLRVVRTELQTALQGTDGFISITLEEQAQAEHEMAKGKACVDFDGSFRRANSLCKISAIDTDDCQPVMRVGILFVQPDCRQRRCYPFIGVRDRIVGPLVGDYSAADAGQPDVRIRECGVHPTCLAKEDARFVMSRARDLVKKQGTAADKIARRAATISASGVGSQEFRLNCTGDAGSDLILDRKELGGLGVVLLGPDMRARGRIDQLCRYSNLLSGPANAAGEDVVRISALANDREPAKTGKCRDDVLGDASCQRIALGVAGHVDEVLHHDRWPGRNGSPGRNKSIAVASKAIAHPSDGRNPVSARRMRSEELPQGRDLHR
jgi:hypothetical protein